jgi:hypothetical protein
VDDRLYAGAVHDLLNVTALVRPHRYGGRRNASIRGSRELSFSLRMPKMIATWFQIPLLERLASKWPISRSSPTASSATCTLPR